MKAGVEHHVPLSTGALDVLRDAAASVGRGPLLFPTVRGRRMHDNALSKLLRDEGVAGVPHGFRSSFRDWAAEHRVPLSDAALSVLGEAREIADPSGLVFPSITGRAMSDSTLSKLLRENGVAAVPHGFRSSFRDWAAECTPFAREVMEAALAHRIPDAIEAAYFRSDLLDRRHELMERWADYITSPT